MEAQAVRDGLDQGDMLNWYRIDRVLGRGGFGITYLATDTNLKTQVAIKEYVPTEVSERDADSSLRPSSPEVKHIFQWGLDRFIAEAQTLARFAHPNIVRVLSVFESNGTAYMVMEYQQGSDLRLHLKNQSMITEDWLKALFRPIIDGLGLVHQSGFIHRDIKPSNIMVREDGSPVLIDFGSARQSSGSQTNTLTSLVTVGYTPLEQYSDSPDDKQGPWTDIYSCGAVLHFAITGRPPPDAAQRGAALLNRSPDPLVPLSEVAAGRFSPPFLHAIDWALGFAIADRPKTLHNWSARLFATQPVAVSSAISPSARAKQNLAASDNDKTMLHPDSARPQDPATPVPAAVSRPQEPVSAKRSAKPPAKPPTQPADDWDMSFLGDLKTAPPPAPDRPAEKSHSVRVMAVSLLLLLAGTAGYFFFSGFGFTGKWDKELSASSAVPGDPLAQQTVNLESGVSADFPVEEATKQIAKLASAVSQADLTAVTGLSEVSAQSLSLLTILFRQFNEVTVDVSPLQTKSGQQVVATLKLVQFTRASGAVAYPAKAFESLVVEVLQSDSGEIQLAL